MTWNYRIVLHDADPDPGKHWYGLHECYYDPTGATGWTANPTTFVCDRDEEPHAIIEALLTAIETLKKSEVIVETDRATWKP